MAEHIDNLLLEHMKRIQAELADSRERDREIITRLGHLETGMADHASILAEHSVRLDRVADRLERIERRLDLVTA